MDAAYSSGSLRESKLAGLRGTIWFCADCQAPRAHFNAPGGVPVCGFCGATPVRPEPGDGDDTLSPFSGYDLQQRFQAD